MSTLKDVKSACRAILGDSRATWTTDGYLIPIINQCYREEITYLSSTCSPYITKDALVPNLDIGTTDLTPFGATPDGPLYNLFNPLILSWKMAGAAEGLYQTARRYQTLPDVSLNPPAAQPYSGLAWEYRSNQLFLTPMQINIDLRVRGEFIPPPLLNEDDVVAVHPLLGIALANHAAAASFRERANPGQMQLYQAAGDRVMDDICNQLVRSQQGCRVRVGRMNSGRRRGGWPGAG